VTLVPFALICFAQIAVGFDTFQQHSPKMPKLGGEYKISNNAATKNEAFFAYVNCWK